MQASLKPPAARVGIFAGSAWDPAEGRETPWVDLARQIAGDKGIAELGPAAQTTPPGTDALSRVFAAADAPVLLLFDEVLNFINRHPWNGRLLPCLLAEPDRRRNRRDPCGSRHQPSAQPGRDECEWDQAWQDRITKVIRRVALDLIANDESEISEVVRRRLFEDLGRERIRQNVARTYADWCFERSARLPSEWTTVDTAVRGGKGREFLRSRFEACYPFHPATLSVFQRKWRALPQFQQTRGALAMLAQWISWASREQFHARRETSH